MKVIEKWKNIPNWPYQISDKGNIRTKRPLGKKLPSREYSNWRYLKPSKDKNGYLGVFLSPNERGGKKRRFYIHKLVWEIFIGSVPGGYCLDHINRNRADNKLTNLRLATPNQNAINKTSRKNTITGYRGVQKMTDTCYSAYINSYGKRIYLGCFDNAEEAAFTYNNAAMKIHGEFAVINKI